MREREREANIFEVRIFVYMNIYTPVLIEL